MIWLPLLDLKLKLTYTTYAIHTIFFLSHTAARKACSSAERKLQAEIERNKTLQNALDEAKKRESGMDINAIEDI